MLKNLIKWACERIDYLDAVVIMAFVLNRGKTSVLTAKDSETLTSEQTARYMLYVGQRALHKPLAYILGGCEFMGLYFEVNEYTLIPRPDTEIVVETALNIIKQTGKNKILEVCTGSGCIAVSLSVLCPETLDITASDISPEALAIAKKNACRHGVSIRFIQADLFEGIDPRAYDLIVANPPYIPHNEIKACPESVKNYEPHIALNGGADGLSFYRSIIEKSVNTIILEIGYNQGSDVRNILEGHNFKDIRVINDLAGHNRVVIAQKVG